jgi:hypothetical protein
MIAFLFIVDFSHDQNQNTVSPTMFDPILIKLLLELESTREFSLASFLKMDVNNLLAPLSHSLALYDQHVALNVDIYVVGLNAGQIYLYNESFLGLQDVRCRAPLGTSPGFMNQFVEERIYMRPMEREIGIGDP